jgi:hypothetical protein
MSPAYFPENLKGRRGGARAMYRVMSEEAEEFYGYHCLASTMVDHSRTVLISWSNSCATIAPPARN